MYENAINKNNAGTSGKKVVIIGLDGVPYSLLKKYSDLNVMPHFHEMILQGSLFPMDSTLPEVSSVAWTSFMTGKNPAEHGVFGFMDIDRNSYEYVFPNFLTLKSRTFWDIADCPTIAFNIPQTYPAKPLHGILVSGFVAIDLQKAVYPKRIYEYLKGIEYRLDVKSELALKDPELFFQDLFSTLEKRTEALKHLYEKEDWQMFIGTITETDRLHHFFFDSAIGGKYHDIFIRFYQMLDDFLWEIFLASQKEKALFLTCSDHGFAPVQTEVYANRYLMEQGLLVPSEISNIRDITSDSKAFCLDPARVYIHSKDIFSRGRVERSEYDLLRNRIKDSFEHLVYEGKKAVKRVYFKEEIFRGKYFDLAPDLYILGEPGFDMKSSFKKESVFGLSHFRGAHTHDDAHLFIAGDMPSDVAPGLSIEKVSPIVLHYLTN
jgi:predicted AlkP superfamily phosphohydrolase/phosphomutase